MDSPSKSSAEIQAVSTSIQLPKVMVAHPLRGGSVSKNFYSGMLTLARTYKGKLQVKFGEGLSVDWSRTLLVEDLLKSDCEYIFFVDSDVGAPHGSLEKLLSHQKDIISGIYFRRTYPFLPTIYQFVDEQIGYTPIIDYTEGLIEIGASGGGCLLIHRKVFETIEKPWFVHPEIDQTEDIYFFEKARKVGIKAYCDTTVKCLHDTEMTITEALFKGNKSE